MAILTASRGETAAQPPRLFITLALLTAALTLGLIVFGAVVRVTDSGLGCGDDWPLCNGTVFPPLDNLTAWIEWLHRLFAAVIGIAGLATLFVAWRAYRRENRVVLNATAAAALLFFIQSMLGALVVVLELPPTFVTLHLGTAMLLLGALLVAALAALHQPRQRTQSDGFTALVYVVTALSLVIILTGALVRGSGATLACLDYPLCDGAILPLAGGQLALIHMFHRLAVAAFVVTLVLLVVSAFRQRQDAQVRLWAVTALVLCLMQAGIGAMYVLTRAAPVWGASHVLFAALTWAALVALSTIETLNNRSAAASAAGEARWQPQHSAAQN